MKSPDPLSLHNQIRVLRIIFFALLTGQAIFFLIAYFLKDSFAGDKELGEIFGYLIPVILFGAIFLSRKLYRNLLLESKKAGLKEKVISYRTAVIVDLAILEGANMISIVAFMLTSEYLYAAASLILFLIFILRAPTDDKLVTDLELTPEELSFME